MNTKMRYGLFSTLVLVLLQLPLYGQDASSLHEQIKLILKFDTEIDFAENEGIWCSVIDEDSTYFLKIGNLELDSFACMNIGSLSKVVSYDLTQNILEQNEISVESSICEFLNLPKVYAEITIEDLLNHTSGLPKQPYFFGTYNSEPLNPYKEFTKENLIQNLITHQNRYKPSSKFLYSHFNYAILELVLESIQKDSFVNIVSASDYSSQVTLNPIDSNLVQGHNKLDQAIAKWQFPSFASSEGMFSNIYDYTNLVKSYLVNYQPNKIKNKLNRDLNFRAPWFTFSEKKNQEVIVMTGTGSGHSIFVGFIPEYNKAVILFRNSAKNPQNLGFYILEMITRKRTNQIVK